MKALHNDTIKVTQPLAFSEVWLTVNVKGRKELVCLDAKKARKLARKINMAASAIEIADLRRGA